MSLRVVAVLCLPVWLLFSEGGPVGTEQLSNQTVSPRRAIRRRDTASLLPFPYLHLPVFVDSKQPLVEKEYFSPARGTGQEPLPEPVRDILLPTRPSSTPQSGASGASVRTRCTEEKMLVQVERAALGSGDHHHSLLKLGTCSVSASTRDHLYFEYELSKCATTRTIIDNQVAYTNTLQYDPPSRQGPIRRAVPFTLPVVCYFNRYQYSYKIGYTPKMQLRKVFKQMKNGAKFILTPRNAQWERLSASDQYMLGKPMYFQAEALSMSHDERLYIHSCYATPEKSHTSMPQFPVVKNFGCMVESKDGRSSFIQYKNNVVRFSVDAFLFKNMMGHQLYMHCTMSVDNSVPTTTAKSCNYDTKNKRWVELYGSDLVCACCDYNCSSAASTATQIISSKPWTIEPKVKSTTTLKKAVSTTKTTAAAIQKETARKVTEWKWTSQPEVAAVILVDKVENTVKELEWPFGGGGVMWVEEAGEEKQVKGSAVVEEEGEEMQVKGSAVVEEEEDQEVKEPHRIFEEIFDFY